VTEECYRHGRKRVRNPAMWKKNIRKRNRARGEEYLSSTGETVLAKRFAIVDCHCPLKCSENIPPDRQQKLNDQFRALSDWSLQTSYITGQVKIMNTQRKYTKSVHSRRKHSKMYYLPNDAGSDKRVCKVFFRSVLGITDGRISRATAQKSDGIPKVDSRGRHIPHNKTSDVDVKHIEEFIKQIPTYESHYSRQKNRNRRYLAPDLNICKLYNLYKSKCTTENRKIISEHVFRKIFNEHFNLSFHPPHQDTCKTCDQLDTRMKVCTSETAMGQLKSQLELHQRKADSARQGLQVDTKMCEDNSYTVLTFDLQKTLPTPVLSTGICYYKRQLWTYNLGVHCMNNDTGFMYVWDESQASRGPEEIASAMILHIENHVDTERLVLYSDCCGGQNRNIKLALLWNYVVQSDNFKVTEIDHKFLVSGHTYLPNDQDFGLIEKNKRFHSDIYVPDDWIKVIETAKKKSPQIVIKRMKNENFISTKDLEANSVNKKKTGDGEKVSWMDIQWIHFDQDHPNVMFFKTSNDPEALFSTVDLSKRAKGRPKSTANITLPLSYPDGKPIARAKLVDLKALLNFIPPIHHTFYKELTSDSTVLGDEIWTDDEHCSSDNDVTV